MSNIPDAERERAFDEKYGEAATAAEYRWWADGWDLGAASVARERDEAQAESDRLARILASLPGSPCVLDLAKAADYQMRCADEARALLRELRDSLRGYAPTSVARDHWLARIDAHLGGEGA